MNGRKKLNFLAAARSSLLVVCTLSGGKFMLLENGVVKEKGEFTQNMKFKD